MLIVTSLARTKFATQRSCLILTEVRVDLEPLVSPSRWRTRVSSAFQALFPDDKYLFRGIKMRPISSVLNGDGHLEVTLKLENPLKIGFLDFKWPPFHNCRRSGSWRLGRTPQVRFFRFACQKKKQIKNAKFTHLWNVVCLGNFDWTFITPRNRSNGAALVRVGLVWQRKTFEIVVDSSNKSTTHVARDHISSVACAIGKANAKRVQISSSPRGLRCRSCRVIKVTTPNRRPVQQRVVLS